VKRPAVPRERELLANQQRARLSGRELERPALARSVSQAQSPASEPEIIAVEARRRESLGLTLDGVDTVVDSVEARQLEGR
jgi:hypothetical protein